MANNRLLVIYCSYSYLNFEIVINFYQMLFLKLHFQKINFSIKWCRSAEKPFSSLFQYPFPSPSLCGCEKQIYISKPYGLFMATLCIKFTGLEVALLLLTAKLLEVSGAYLSMSWPWIHSMIKHTVNVKIRYVPVFPY